MGASGEKYSEAADKINKSEGEESRH